MKKNLFKIVYLTTPMIFIAPVTSCSFLGISEEETITYSNAKDKEIDFKIKIDFNGVKTLEEYSMKVLFFRKRLVKKVRILYIEKDGLAPLSFAWKLIVISPHGDIYNIIGVRKEPIEGMGKLAKTWNLK